MILRDVLKEERILAAKDGANELEVEGASESIDEGLLTSKNEESDENKIVEVKVEDESDHEDQPQICRSSPEKREKQVSSF